MRKNRRVALMAAVAATGLIGSFAQATTFVWDGGDGTSASWSTPVNWTTDTVPTSADQVQFDNTGVARLGNTVDVGLATTTFSQLLYRQDAPTNVYTTSIDRGVALTLTGQGLAAASNTTIVGNSSLVVMPTSDTTAFGGSTGATVVFKSTGTGTQGSLNITANDVLISGRPGTSNGSSSFGILDLRQLDSFSFTQAFPQQTGNNTVFGIGTGNGGGNADNGAYWGEVYLAPVSSITSNRISVGGQNNAGTSATPNINGMQPVSSLRLGQLANLNTNISGNFYVGGDAGGNPAKDGSGVILFQAGLTNPVVNMGGGGAFANGLEIARQRASTGHSAFGVIDTTSASGTSEGELNGIFASMFISAQSAGATGAAGGGFGMLTMDKGAINNIGSLVITRTASAATAGTLNVGILNVGLKGAATDLGGGALTSGSIVLGQRIATDSSSGGSLNGYLNLDNNGVVTTDRVLVGNNTVAAGNQPVNAFVDLAGGTLITGQVMAGSDTAQAGTTLRIINFDGGTLKVKAGTSQAFRDTFFEGHSQANVFAGGGTIDTNGQDMTVKQALQAPAGNGVKSISVDNGGSGYRSAPIVFISGDGTGASAVARIDSTGTVIGIDVVNPGTGYTTPPTIQLIANGGTSLTNIAIPYGGVAATVTPTLGANSSSGGITKAGVGVLTLTGNNTYGGATNVLAGTLKVNTAAATPLLNNTAGTDIQGGRVVFDYTAAADQAAYKANLKSIVATAYAGNFATGQIHSSTATPQIGLGYNDDTASSSYTVARAYYGDGNLDGTVDTTDFNVLATNFNKSGQDWINGDFNYDGVVNMLDFNSVATNYGSSLPVAAPALGALVPEPASITLIGLAGLSLMRRRRQA